MVVDYLVHALRNIIYNLYLLHMKYKVKELYNIQTKVLFVRTRRERSEQLRCLSFGVLGGACRQFVHCDDAKREVVPEPKLHLWLLLVIEDPLQTHLLHPHQTRPGRLRQKQPAPTVASDEQSTIRPRNANLWVVLWSACEHNRTSTHRSASTPASPANGLHHCAIATLPPSESGGTCSEVHGVGPKG